MRIRTETDLHFALERDLVIPIRAYGAPSGVIRRGIRDGHLISVLPGIYSATEMAAQPLVRMAALRCRQPNAVFTGLSAAGLIWAPRFFPSTVSATGRLTGSHPGFALVRRQIGSEWMMEANGFRCTRPELTAVDLISDYGGDFVDLVLREAKGQGRTVLNRMWQAVVEHSDRRGNKQRRRILRESRDLPWSAAERRVHRDLRDAGVTGWKANYPVQVGDAVFCIDIAFPQIKLALEVDGFEYHASRSAFEIDRERQNLLVCAGWRVLRVTWAMLDSTPWVSQLRNLMPGR